MGKFHVKKPDTIKALEAAHGKDPIPASASAKSEKVPKPQKEKTRDFSNDLRDVCIYLFICL